MLDKEVASADEAIAGVRDGDVVLISGFGPPGQPDALIDALVRTGVGGLTVVNNNANAGGESITRLFESGAVAKVVCSFPRGLNPRGFEELYRQGRIELELVPQGTLAERIRAAGAGVEGFYTRTGYGTELQGDKETKEFDGKGYVLERALHGDVALVRASTGDRWGNLVYSKTARNFGPIMAMAAAITAVEVTRIVDAPLDPEAVVTPGIYVDRLLQRRTSGDPA